MSQDELGEKLLVSRQTISLWEKDQTVPTIENLMRLKEIFGISVDEILCADEKSKMKKNVNSLDTVCAALAYALGIQPPKYAAEMNWELANYIDKVFDGNCGSHGLDMVEDINIVHLYKGYVGKGH